MKFHLFIFLFFIGLSLNGQITNEQSLQTHQKVNFSNQTKELRKYQPGFVSKENKAIVIATAPIDKGFYSNTSQMRDLSMSLTPVNSISSEKIKKEKVIETESSIIPNGKNFIEIKRNLQPLKSTKTSYPRLIVEEP